MIQLTIHTFQRKSQRDRIYDMLQNNDFVPTAALRLFAYQYNARIKELREIYGQDRIIACRQDGKYGFKWLNENEID